MAKHMGDWPRQIMVNWVSYPFVVPPSAGKFRRVASIPSRSDVYKVEPAGEDIRIGRHELIDGYEFYALPKASRRENLDGMDR